MKDGFETSAFLKRTRTYPSHWIAYTAIVCNSLQKFPRRLEEWQ